MTIPIDQDGNGIADVWERAKLQEWNQQYQGDEPKTPFGGGGIFFRPEDSEKPDPDGAAGPLVAQKSGGDHIPVFDEYRGFLLGGSALPRGQTQPRPARARRKGSPPGSGPFRIAS